MATDWHLAQVNIGMPRAPMDSEVMARFAAMLEPINALADGAPGFVWRLQDDDGDATGIRPFEDAGELPTTQDARERLELLREQGATPAAFTFKHRFQPPSAPDADAAIVDDRDPCPA